MQHMKLCLVSTSHSYGGKHCVCYIASTWHLKMMNTVSRRVSSPLHQCVQVWSTCIQNSNRAVCMPMIHGVSLLEELRPPMVHLSCFRVKLTLTSAEQLHNHWFPFRLHAAMFGHVVESKELSEDWQRFRIMAQAGEDQENACHTRQLPANMCWHQLSKSRSCPSCPSTDVGCTEIEDLCSKWNLCKQIAESGGNLPQIIDYPKPGWIDNIFKHFHI